MCMTQNKFDNCLQSLSKQQKEVLKLFLNGQNDAEIAIEIAKKVNSKPIKPSTVKSHISHICNEFGLIDKESRGYDQTSLKT